MESLEMKRRYYKRKKAEIWKKINKIAQENKVPTWMARLYFYYGKETRNFLYFRNMRLQENYKNVIKENLGGNSEIENIDVIDWKKLYEIIGKDATDKFPIDYILETIASILVLIELSTLNKKVIPYEFEREVLSQCYVPEKNFKVVEESLKRYLLTELPEGSEIDLELFTKVERGPQKRIYIGGGCTHQFDYQSNDEINLYIKVKFSYSNTI